MKIYLSFFILIIRSFYVDGLTVNNNGLFRKDNSIEDRDVGSPLFLTSLIESGKIEEAKQKARVNYPEFKNIESYAGYFTVNKEINSNLFFWYFPSQSNSTSDPVLLWLQGGPGASSLNGLFNINGPFIITNNTLEFREYSWNLNHNVLYIDSPVGTGYSFTQSDAGYATNQNDVSRDLYIALTQFFDLFPELRSNDFYATGESYSGKYIPALAKEIKNRNVEASKKINLVGLSIGNGWSDPINQIDYSDYLYQIGLIDDNGKRKFDNTTNKVKDLIKEGKYTEAKEAAELIMGFRNDREIFKNLTGYTSPYNYLQITQNEDTNNYVSWVQQASVRKAIHVGNNDFNASSSEVLNLLSDDIYRSMANVVADLIQHYRTLIYTGQLDIICPYPLVVNYLRQLKWPGATEYETAERKQWWVGDELAGYSKTARNLTEILVRNAGHMAPADQPLWIWSLITNFTRHQEF